MAHSGGGGSHGGGSHGGSHGGRSGSSGATVSKKYFKGSYYHSYVDRRGKTHTYYSSKEKVNKPSIVSLILAFFMLGPFIGFAFIFSVISALDFPGKVDGTPPEQVRVIDTLDCFTDEQEQALNQVLGKYYETTGVNANVYTVSNDEWETHYSSLETFSMEKYYQMYTDEQHYLVVFSNKVLEDGWQDWKFETVVGDDTTSVLGTKRENYMTERLQNNLWSNEENPALGIQTSFEELIEYSQTTHIDWYSIFVASFIICIFIVVFVIAVHGYRKSMDEYNYVQMYPESVKNPEHYHLQCPNCSAPNTTLEDSCAYCGTVLLKVND